MLKSEKRAIQSLNYFFEDVVNQMDLFGSLPTFRILKRSKFSSKLGLLMSLGLLTTIVVYLIFELISLGKFENPSVVSSQSQILESSAFPLNINNFTIAITVTDASLNPLKDINKHFVITMQQCKRTRIINPITQKLEVTLNCTDYPLENCNKDHFVTPLSSSYFSKVRFGTVQCLKKEIWEQSPPVFQGTVSGDLFQYIEIKFRECRNTTTKTDCAPQEEIVQKLNSGYYAIYLSDNLVKMDLPGVPFEEIINQQSTTFSITSSKKVYQSLQIQQSNSDYGIVGHNYHTDHSLIWYQMRESQEIYNQDYLISHIIRLDTRVSTYQRTYIKLQTVLSKIGGLWQVLFLILTVISKPIVNTLMNAQMVNKLFTFEQSQNEENKKNKKQTDQLDNQGVILTKRDNQQSSNLTSYKREYLQTQQQLKEYFRDKKKTFQLNIFNIICIVLGCRTKKKRQLDYGKEKIMQKLDVASLISKILEIDKLKYVLLNEEQQNLFNYIPKPIIPCSIFNSKTVKFSNLEELEQRKAYRYILQDEKSDFMKFQQAYIAYQAVLQNPEKTDVDMQILSYLDEEVIQMFESMRKDSRMVVSLFQNSPYKSNKYVFSSVESPRQGEIINLQQ